LIATSFSSGRAKRITAWLESDRRDDPVGLGDERGVRGLVPRSRHLRFRLLEPRFGGVERGLAGVEDRAADELPRVQVPIALDLGGGEVVVGGDRGELRARGVDAELRVLRVEPGQRLAARHRRAHVDVAGDHLAADPEREIVLVPGAHFAGVDVGIVGSLCADDLRDDGAGRRGLGRRLAAGSERRGKRDHQDRADGGHEHLQSRRDQ
jgi:hypothetical protein